MPRSTAAGHETLDDIGSNEFLLGQSMRALETNACCRDSDVMSCALFAGGFLKVRCT